ncbi:MAG: hypothetical protein HGA45_37115, partial [Chloroflexales bacterium]|nr:hypothetical protein [Chloroflexales bacterium]
MPLQTETPFTGNVLAEFSGRDLESWLEFTAPLSGARVATMALPLQPEWLRCFVRLSL